MTCTWYKISSNTKYWSSFVAVNWTSLNTSLSTIRSVVNTSFFNFSQCDKCLKWKLVLFDDFFKKKKEERWKLLHLWNYGCQARKTIIHLEEAWVFALSSKRVGIMANAFEKVFSCIANSIQQLESMVWVNHDKIFSSPVNSSLATLYERIPTLDTRYR